MKWVVNSHSRIVLTEYVTQVKTRRHQQRILSDSTERVRRRRETQCVDPETRLEDLRRDPKHLKIVLTEYETQH